MTWALDDRTGLLLVLVVLYVIEGIVWVPSGAVLFRASLWARYARLYMGSLFPNEQGGFCLMGLMPANVGMISQQWPVSLSQEGAFAYVATSLGGPQRPDQTEMFIPWTELHSVASEGLRVSVNGELFVEVCSPHVARRICDVMQSLPDQTDAQRTETIQSVLRDTTSLLAVTERLGHLKRALRLPSLISWGMWLIAFVATPVLLWIAPRDVVTVIAGWGALMLFVCLWIGAVFAYRRAVAQLRSVAPSVDAVMDRTWLLIYSPAAAMWLPDRLARDFLADLHPLAIAAVMCTGERYRNFARRVIRDVHQPLLPNCPDHDAAPQATEKWFREQLLSALERTIADSGESVVSLIAPPAKVEDAHSYCPRCDMQYVHAQGCCGTCGGVQLESFA
jgi:hypothetical protein